MLGMLLKDLDKVTQGEQLLVILNGAGANRYISMELYHWSFAA